MKNRKTLTTIGLIVGIIAILMCFVIPFFLSKSMNDFSMFYFITFLVFVGVGNYTLEKSLNPFTLMETRVLKLKRILK